MRHHVTCGLGFEATFSDHPSQGSPARARGINHIGRLLAALILLTAASASAQEDIGGTFVERFVKDLTKFSPPTSYTGAAALSYANSSRLGLPQATQGSLPRGAVPLPADNLPGVGLHLIEAGANSTVGPLEGEPGLFSGDDINMLLGAFRFYGASANGIGGLNGQNTVVANIEGGRAWKGHETLGHLFDIPATLQPSQLDRHATWTAAILAGRPGGALSGTHQTGIAPGAELHSGGFATTWGGTRYSFGFSFFSNVLFTQYEQAMLTGLAGPNGVHTADVVNSSYAIVGEPVASTVELMLDALANTNPNSTIVFAAGNSGLGVNRITAPATSYNGITVASLTALEDYDSPSVTSSGGEIDYKDPINGTAPAVRRGVDIAAPGEDLGSAYYGGLTGGNSATLTGMPSGEIGGPDYYTRDLDGTSYATPLVAGGATLLHDAAYAILPALNTAHDSRVIKAVLMNSADKTAGWNNGQTPHRNGNGGVETGRDNIGSLDRRVGAGRMNLESAFDQFLSGTTDVPGENLGDQGKVQEVGWDFGRVAEGTPTDYFITRPLEGGTTLTTTLTWFRDRRIMDTGNGILFTDDNFADLDLEVWSVASDAADLLISESVSTFNNTEHLSFELPETGRYMIRVKWFQEIFDSAMNPNQTYYALAWTGTAIPIPEPSTFALFAVSLFGVVVWRVRTRRKSSL